MSGWDSKEDSKLMDLLGKGHPYSEIAAIMNKTRSAIAGRVGRLRHKAPIEVRKKLRRRVLATPSTELSSEAFQVPLLDLTPESCRWPSDSKINGQTLFCGLQSLKGKPYCPHHTQKAKRSY